MDALDTATLDARGGSSRQIDPAYLLPSPMPDETIRSVWERFHRMSISGSMKETLEALFGPGARLRSGHCLPSRLTELSRRVGADHPLGNTRYVIERHTTLPFHCYFHTAPQREDAFASLLGDRGPAAARATLGMAKALVLEEREWPAFCPVCVAHDQATVGFSYWRTIHQLPPVAVCPWHGCRLREVHGERTDWSGYGYLPPPDLGTTPAESFPVVECDVRISKIALLRLAQACLHMQRTPSGFPGNWREQTISTLINMGFKSKGGLDHRRIVKGMYDVHGEPMLTWLKLGTPDKPLSDRALRRALGVQRDRQPSILYLMLSLTTGGNSIGLEDSDKYEQSSTGSGTIGNPYFERLVSRAKAGDKKELFTLSDSHRVDHMDMRRKLLQHTGQMISRATSMSADERGCLIQDARVGMTSSRIRGKYHLHLDDVMLVLEHDSVARRRMERADFLESRDRLRSEALDFLKRHAALSTAELSKALTHRFKSLQRYDIDWCLEHLPPPLDAGRGNVKLERLPQADEALNGQIARAIRALTAEDGPQPLSKGEVLSRCKASAFYRRHHRHLPKSANALSRLAA